MSSIVPFPQSDEPFEDEDESFVDRGYEGPVPEIDPNATLLTVTQVSFLLNLPCEVTRENLADGGMPGWRLGDEWLISRARLGAWINGLSCDEVAW